MLEPTSFLLLSATLTSATAFQSVPKGEKGAVLHKQELHTEVSTSFGYRDFLRVVQRFGAAVNVCVNVVPHSPVPCTLITRSWAAAGVGIFAGQLKERAL